MRIEPDSDTLPALRPATGAASGGEFASALTSARNSLDSSLPESSDMSHVGETPLAERWGQYGSGATAQGYAEPPDPAKFRDLPVGPNAPASPLNPGGITTTPSFTVDGYTGRGTPIPPGFYNLAYYEEYLQQGGTPLEGFPLMADGATYIDTYGTFGDGRARATSFLAPAATPSGDNTVPAAPCAPSAATSAGAPESVVEAAPEGARTADAASDLAAASGAAPVADAAPTRVAAPTSQGDAALPSSVRRVADAARQDDAPAAVTQRPTLTRPAFTREGEALVRAEINAMLRDLLGAA